jgi:head-tail adaptor
VIGALRDRVVFERRDRSPDTGGGAAPVWTPVAVTWASVTPRTSGESGDGDGRRHVTAYDVTVRRRTNVSAGMRLVWRGRLLYIRGLKDAGPRDAYMTLTADDGELV